MKDIIKWLALGGAAYWVYSTYFATPAVATPATTPATTPVTPAAGSLAAIYTKIAAAAPTGASYTADQWNTFLKSQSTVTPPDPASVFTFTDAAPRTAGMTLAQYWAAMEPYLVKQGMSGLGLYAGMGAFYRRRF